MQIKTYIIMVVLSCFAIGCDGDNQPRTQKPPEQLAAEELVGEEAPSEQTSEAIVNVVQPVEEMTEQPEEVVAEIEQPAANNVRTINSQFQQLCELIELLHASNLVSGIETVPMCNDDSLNAPDNVAVVTPDELQGKLCGLIELLHDNSIAETLNVPDYCPGVHVVGDTGPSGGTIFYVDKSGKHGLEVAPTDVDGIFEWGCDGVDIDTSTEFGTGSDNTQRIINNCTTGIATAVAGFTGPDGVSDGWFVPSNAELDLLRSRSLLIDNGLSIHVGPDKNYDIRDLEYWTSSEIPDGDECYYYGYCYEVSGTSRAFSQSAVIEFAPVPQEPDRGLGVLPVKSF